MSSPSTYPCSVECAWLGASVGAGPGTWGSIRVTYANGIILAPINLLRKSWNVVEFWGLPPLIPLLQCVNRLGFQVCSVNSCQSEQGSLVTLI